MQPTVQSLGIDRLNVGDRMRLVEEIWDTILAEAKPADLPLLIDERIAAHDADPIGGVSWEETKAKARKGVEGADQEARLP